MKNLLKVVLYSVVVAGLFNLSSCLKSPAPDFDYLGQFKKDTANIKSYLKANNIQAIGLSQGIWFTIDAPSAGLHPTWDDTVFLTYKMRLMSDNSIVGQSSGSELWRMSSLIPGVQIALPKFQKGSWGHIYIPSFWAYQNIKTSSIPPNSNLIFEFKLDEVYDHQLKVDTTTIGNYLRAQHIAHSVDVSGLQYTITNAGSGVKPTLSDSVKITYTAKFFPDGNTIYQHTSPVTALITDLPIGACIGLTNLQEGGSATMYLPSSLAFGPLAQAGIPENSNIVYTMELIKVIHH